MVAMGGDVAVERLLGGAQPVALLPDGTLIGAQLVANVEVAIAQGLVVGALADPVVVHAHGAEHHLTVVAAQVFEDGEDALGLHLEEHGVDELHHVVATPARQARQHLGRQTQSTQRTFVAREVDVARIVFPEVAIGGHRDVVSQRAQSFGQCGVDVAVFAQ